MTAFRRALMGGLVAVALTASLVACADEPLAEDALGGSDQPADGAQFAGDGSWGEYAPDQRGEPVMFEGETETGETLGTTQLAGGVSVVNFWYAACPPCRVEAADLEAVSQNYADDGVQFVGVNIYDQVPTIESFNAEFGITYPSILDVGSGSVLAAFADNVPPQAIPTTLVLDREGRVASFILGVAEPAVLEPMIDAVLAEST